jgi:hypothetical protein
VAPGNGAGKATWQEGELVIHEQLHSRPMPLMCSEVSGQDVT